MEYCGSQDMVDIVLSTSRHIEFCVGYEIRFNYIREVYFVYTEEPWFKRLESSNLGMLRWTIDERVLKEFRESKLS